MTTIIGISGSLREGSLNSALLRAAVGLMPAGSVLKVESIAEIPLYNGDDERDRGIPPAVTRIKDAIAAADGWLLASPEYNHSIPGVAKNAIDWLSRPSGDAARVFRGRPVALAGASPGGFGTVLAQNAWLPVFRTLGCDFWAGGRLIVSRADTLFDDSGNLVDPKTREALGSFLSGFVAHVRQKVAAGSGAASR